MKIIWSSVSGDGFQAELVPVDVAGKVLGQLRAGIGTIGQDEDGTFWFEVFDNGAGIRVPLAEVEQAIADAKEEVHCESYYDGLAQPDEP
ncbi:hypothetical protein [Pseudoxanthomonas sp. JBR18]|uniref:hypothetical protein n=1 Tax=Pseudoxanthomonas sp. JBR18 TaxID=2969308 RepID=UPI0023058402|nr:hypothetical protein [Pseudoxanthomonas sp. JBR18]WCE03971.1 hypothetical protein PJ250_18140 [Pseudoxanthomonas sp. JBR18]